MEDAACRVRLRIRHDLLAAAARLAGGEVWDRLHRTLLDELGEADQIDWERACLDSASVLANKGDPPPGQIQRIAANRARSAMLWLTDAGRH
jgi:hypothetical protein